MSAKRLSRYNPISMARAAILYRGRNKQEPATPRMVAEYFFKRYGSDWKINSVEEMESQHTLPSRGARPNLAKLFDGKNREQIKTAYREWVAADRAKKERLSGSLKQLYRTPLGEKKRKNSARVMAELNRTPKMIAKATAQIRALNSDEESRRRNKEMSSRWWKAYYEKNPERRRAEGARLKIARDNPTYRREHSERWSRIMRENWRNKSWSEATSAKIRKTMNDSAWRDKQREKKITERLLAKDRKAERYDDPRTKLLHPTTGETTADRVIQREKNEIVRKAVKSLTGKERRSIELLFYEGLQNDAAAKTMRLSEEKFMQILDLAKKKLATKLSRLIDK